MFAVVDIETTGGSPRNEKITEIAIYLHDGLSIVDEFATLINPECTIPYFITGLTGISNEMVADAPRFYEVAKKIVEFTEGKIFVGHNVNFDYSFVRQEFKNLGYEFNRKTLDTVKLARQVIPGLRSYSLGRLCQHMGITITDRHRASGDALATVQVLERLLALDSGKIASRILKPGVPQGLNQYLDKKLLDKLPEETGVYYFWDENGSIIYIGKSINIRSRIHQHLYNNTTHRAMEMKDRVADISWELTGNELVALLLESAEIKEKKPLYNRKLRRSMFSTGLFAQEDKEGYIRLKIDQYGEGDYPITSFTSKTEAKEILHRWVEEFNLCQKLCGLYESSGACFHHGIGECMGACAGIEPSESYNSRVKMLLNKFEYDHHSFLILLPGRMKDEIAIIGIENGKYLGFGYAPAEFQANPALLMDCIKYYPDNRDVHSIIKLYLRRNGVKIIEF